MPQAATPAAPQPVNPAGEPAASTIPFDADILAAVNGALEKGGAPAVDHEAATPVEDAVADPPEGDAPAADAAAPGDAAASPDAATPDAAAAATPAGDAPAATPAAAPDAAAGAKPSDEFGDLPTDAKAETRERFGKLKTAYDAKVAEHAQAVADREAWTNAVRETGATPEQFGQSLGYIADINSGDPARLENAYNTLHAELVTLAKALGKPLPGVHDPLEGHADLQNMLDMGADREALERIAGDRARAQLTEQGRRQLEAQQAGATAAQTALDALKDFGATARATDPLFAAKMAAIGPAVQAVVAKLPPAEWLPTVRDLYAKAVVAAPAPAPRAPAGPVVPNAVRGGNAMSATGPVAKAPASAEEAMAAALATLARGKG